MSDYFTKKDAEEFKKDIKRYIGILAGDFQHRLDIAIDGLASKIDSVDKRLREEIREVKGELIAHRDNTEAHAQRAKG
jgi:hypothetical protein